MSKYDYERSQQISSEPFYAIIMAAMRNADTDNLEALRKSWPNTFSELQLRYSAPGGCLTYEEFQREYDNPNITQEMFDKMSK